jgi:hypothetical protein
LRAGSARDDLSGTEETGHNNQQNKMGNTIKTITCIAAIGLAILAKAEVYTFETFKADFGSIPSVENHPP